MDPITEKVRSFYEEFSFPGYDDCDSLATLVDRAQKGIYANLLNTQIPFQAQVLDVGCGTGQLVNFLSANGRRVVGCDLSFNSLSKAVRFRNQFLLESASFVHADIFSLPFREQGFDVVLCNGVLHHTRDPYDAFAKVCRMAKTGGYIVVGLYNRFARTALNLRKTLLYALRIPVFNLNKLLLRRAGSRGTRQTIWFKDQYEHPRESTHTVDQILGWFRKNDILYLNSIPKIDFLDDLTHRERLFAPHQVGGRIEHLLTQLGWIFTQAHEGGFFILIGKKSS